MESPLCDYVTSWLCSWTSNLFWKGSIHITLTLSTPGKNFSRRHFEIFFLIFPRKQNLTFHANCLQWRQFAWNVKFCYLGKIRKNIISLSSAELAKRVVKVKVCQNAAVWVSKRDTMFSRTSMARTSLGRWKCFLEFGSFSHSGLILASGQETNGGSLRMYFRSFDPSRKHAYIILTPLNPTFI